MAIDITYEPPLRRSRPPLSVMGVPCEHALDADSRLFKGANGITRYLACHMCDENWAKDGQGLGRFMMCSVLFTPRGRRFYDGRRTTRRSATRLRRHPRLVRVGTGEAS
eukprot:6191163-Pyramimonas_sp.AAC.1